MTGLQTKEVRLSKLDEDIARMEAALYSNGGAEQDEQVLDDQKVVNPDASSNVGQSLTEGEIDKLIAHEDTLKPNDEELGKLRKELSEVTHRANRYKGSTDRTIFDLRSEVTRLNKIIVDLNTKVETLTPGTKADGLEVSQDVRDILGDETADLVASLKQEVGTLKSELGKKETDKFAEDAATAQATNEREFRDKLEELVPDLDAMNKDPKFNEWLRQPGSNGVVRLATLRSDQKRFDYDRVAGFFSEYKTSVKEEVPAKPVDTVDAHRGPTGTQGASSDSMKNEGAKDTIMMSEINQFNADVAAGVYKYESAKAEAMETKIFNANRDNKIIFDVNPN